MSTAYRWPDDLAFDSRGRRLFCAGCDKPLEQVGHGVRVYCSRACGRRRNYRLRHAPARSKSPSWEQLKADAPKGVCVVCEHPLPHYQGKGRPRVICKAAECARAFRAIAKADERKSEGGR